MVIDNTNGIILLDTQGEIYTPTSATGIDVENIILEGTASAVTVVDNSGHTLAILDTLGFYLPINRWVDGIGTSVQTAGSNVRVYLKKAAR